MTPGRLAEIRQACNIMPWGSLPMVRELLDHIARLEAQRGTAVVVPDELDVLRSFYEIIRCHMMAEGGIPMTDALGAAMDTLDEIRGAEGAAKLSLADRFANCPRSTPCTPHGRDAGNGEWPRCPKAGDVEG